MEQINVNFSIFEKNNFSFKKLNQLIKTSIDFFEKIKKRFKQIACAINPLKHKAKAIFRRLYMHNLI